MSRVRVRMFSCNLIPFMFMIQGMYKRSFQTLKDSVQGVRTDTIPKVRVVYRKSIRNKGVRRHDVMYSYPYISKEPKNIKPCLCGSLYHSRTTHISCLLNKRYDDPIPIEKQTNDLFLLEDYLI